VLCLQEDIADRVTPMLKGAMAELGVGNPDRLSVDVGPVISDEARRRLDAHIARMRQAGHAVFQVPLGDGARHGTFVPPTLIEIDAIADLPGEVFGPVLHVLRYRREDMEKVVRAVNRTGFGLTFGVHSRIDETIAHVLARAPAGNFYVNRTLIGAVVGVQPFGGHGLSGTGPKAGGPLYLRRLLARHAPEAGVAGEAPAVARAWVAWLEARGADAAACRAMLALTPVGAEMELPGPVGEQNLYSVEPRGVVLCVAREAAALHEQVGAALATGNRALVPAPPPDLPPALTAWVAGVADLDGAAFDAVLFDGQPAALLALAARVAARPGPIVPILARAPDAAYPLDMLVRERAVSTNTTAAGGNASLMMLG